MLSSSHFYFNKAADVLEFADENREILLTPLRVGKAALARTPFKAKLPF